LDKNALSHSILDAIQGRREEVYLLKNEREREIKN
jgi:hypothetical protein